MGRLPPDTAMSGDTTPGATYAADVGDEVRERELETLLDAVAAGDLTEYVQGTAASGTWAGQLRRLAQTLTGDWAAALAEVSEPDPDAAALAASVTGWAAAWCHDDPAPPVLDAVPAGAAGEFVRYVAAEALLAQARIEEATRLAGQRPVEPLVLGGRAHPFGAVMVACRARMLAFSGDLDAALAVLGSVDVTPLPPALAAVHHGTACFLAGNRAERADVRRRAAAVDELAPQPSDHLSRGSHLLAAFGLVAVAELADAARQVLVAGGLHPDLRDLTVVDRALGLEMLVALAIDQGDTDAAEAWSAWLEPLLGSSAGDSTAARALSRVELARGAVEDAVAWGEVATARAARSGRGIEQAEAEIVLARARMHLPSGRPAVARNLADVVAAAEARGHLVVRRAAARELRSVGLRMVPVTGSAWSGLTGREREVARLVADGASNRQVARRLRLSENTVRAHVSRVLAAFGVATRAELPRAMADGTSYAAPSCSLDALTPRQREVAELVAEGLGNAKIAQRLGISARTVDKHVTSILLCWGLSGRTAIAREVVAAR
ncbi:LuxR C-terminal-related transcriptional regulator [Nocardioides sp. URHA0020]|uniref:LuxR C-terminal-related transcriptional regulator n=1 Tax=Nocardioides sp. URHA0020 TaxID=1380392 RepID=UPI0004906725|nr:LuxR C-terminal-related transcriptional regulator [Nocardioides sp. URHA0020]